LASAYDIEYDSVNMDMNSPKGFVLAMVQMLQLKPGSSTTLAPVCSTWVWMYLRLKFIGNMFVLFHELS